MKIRGSLVKSYERSARERRRVFALRLSQVLIAIGFATPHLSRIVEAKHLRGIILTDHENPITIGIVTEVPRVLFRDDIEFGIVEIRNRTARPGRKRNESTIGR